MRSIRDTTHIRASRREVWAWLESMADHYTDWHPDHVSAEWIRGTPNQVGAELEVVEGIGGHQERLRFRLTRLIPERLYRYEIRGVRGWLLPGGAFELADADGGTVFVASIDCRWGSIVERILARRVEELRRHMREEGANLARLLDAQAVHR